MFQVAVLPPRPEYSTRGTGGGTLLQSSHPDALISTGSNDPSRCPGQQGFQRVTLLPQLRRRSRHSSTLSSRLNNLSRRSIRCVIRIMGRSFHHLFTLVRIGAHVCQRARQKVLDLIGIFCSAIKRSLVQVVLRVPVRLARLSNVPIVSGGSTEVWRREHQGIQVTIKAFCAQSA